MKRATIPLSFAILATKLLVFFVSLTISSAQCPTLVWSDEFSNSSLDLTKWSYQIGDGCAEGICGWGNNELQYYQEQNVTVSNGQLHITAKKERVKAKSYTSGRIRTIDKGDWTYGRFESRIKLPAGKGLWPAFWMLPTDEVYGGWPQSGEIDIMEFVAADPTRILGTIHYGDPYPDNKFQGGHFSVNSGTFPEAFYDFAIEWEPGVIRWFVNDILYLTKTAADIAPYQWPFDQRFHFIMNVAVGGNLGGPVDDSIFPSTMSVDYVRVYNGLKPYITGDMTVSNKESGVVYSTGNIPAGTNVTWSVPSGATIVSGQGTSEVTVNFGSSSGNVTASFTTCATQQLSIPVEVEPPYAKEFSFENFDEPATASLGTYTGTYSEVNNPSVSGVNTSALSGMYTRNASEQYDVLVYNVTNITDASRYTDKTKKFYMDVLTNAPVGTEILLQLETSTATSTNYPSGRHSRYVGTVTAQNEWQRIAFELLDRPDASASDTGVEKMILLFASNSFTGDTYYYDNLDSYNAQTETGNSAPVVSITSPASGASFASGTSVSVSANASDSDGTISQVEFFANGTSVGVDVSSPYSLNWTIGTGTFSLTAIATDNGGATTVSEAVSVTGTSETASSMHVASITTGTINAGGGNKQGTATVTIKDNQGNPVSNATVTGTFSGSFSETKSGVTDSKGSVTLVTTAKLKGTVTVNLCVTDVTHGSLPYNSADNVITCTGTSARSAGQIQMIEETDPLSYFEVFPNPFNDKLEVKIHLLKESRVHCALIDGKGAEIGIIYSNTLPAGTHFLKCDPGNSGNGLYFVRTIINNRQYVVKARRSK